MLPSNRLFNSQRRLNLERRGQSIEFRANHYQLSTSQGFVHHYDVNIIPENCPQLVNKAIIQTMVAAYSGIFGTIQLVFNSRDKIYTRTPLSFKNNQVELEVTLPIGNHGRVFRVNIKWSATVLERRIKQIPCDAIIDLDITMRHSPSMTCTPIFRSYFPLPEFNRHLSFDGSYVTYTFPGINVNRTRSISATLIESMHTHLSQYATTVHLQQNRQESIHKLNLIVKELLGMYYNETGGLKPRSLKLYQHRVSEEEIPHLRSGGIKALLGINGTQLELP
ncbi:protein argonaute-2-like [Melanaphis sacchari]|uniref:protein argonaute-2-like n=1 Tax=Melanaphis sacchari TaxID=742174 RepID=UPI000DC138D0|nr:protein argonaute-2-like [Melanaphis sacchari]